MFSRWDWSGKVALVTGASEGIGRALCLELASRGCRLGLLARNGQRLEELAAQCRGLGSEALCLPANVAEESQCRQAVERAVSHFGRLDLLVNNAGIANWCRLDEVQDLSIYDQCMRVNYLGAVYCTYHALPHLKQTRGQIAGVSSVAGLTGVPKYTAYAATKHALFGFFDSLRIELAASGVTVTMIAPDFVSSSIHGRALGPDGQPLGKSPRQEDEFMSTRQCAEQIVRALERRQRLLVMSWRGRMVGIGKRFAPGLLDRIAARANRR